MITKTEVSEVLRVLEPKAGTTLDTSPVIITRGQLRVLVEAAKTARFTQVTFASGLNGKNAGDSGADFTLGNDPRLP